ncbi:MAG: hypothetical protein EAZ85_07550 [Bacteroidetes bacterium]|nr:MAG: hypothetical protein EAZ85_07550 [Bacteroidota bacterium]TAG87225.1 MAG: hypothetical protein EAZ20_11105 [Bacteroidota bacterium]
MNDLVKNGWQHFTNQTEKQFLEIANGLGEIIQETNVIVKPDSKALVTSAKGLGLHTDHHKANFVAWFCYKQTSEGGETLLLDARKAFALVDKPTQDALKTIHLFEHKVFEDDDESCPLVYFKEQEIRFYFSFWLMKMELSNTQKRALEVFYEAIKNTEKVALKLQKNDILIVNNHYILHGRNAIVGSQDRFLKRLWITKK